MNELQQLMIANCHFKTFFFVLLNVEGVCWFFHLSQYSQYN